MITGNKPGSSGNAPDIFKVTPGVSGRVVLSGEPAPALAGAGSGSSGPGAGVFVAFVAPAPVDISLPGVPVTDAIATTPGVGCRGMLVAVA
ncbi:MAG TPA: hypothetical protein VHB98_11550 [Chloroflexota bacterium]|nr:hypothetical protein [Chloroflexota bacterium]